MASDAVSTSKSEQNSGRQLSPEQAAAAEIIVQAREQGLDLTGPGGLLKMFTKNVLETSLNEEMTEHLGHEKHQADAERESDNVRNETQVKTVISDAAGIAPVTHRSGSSIRGEHPARTGIASSSARSSSPRSLPCPIRSAAPTTTARGPRARSTTPLCSLALGCDCLGTIRYFDVTVHNQHGEPIVIPQAICMHEEDYGVVWKHTDFRTGKTETRRNRRLVISSFAVLGNYQYGYFWYFYLDGTIEFEVKLTGMISTGAARPGDTPQHGTLVAPGLYGPNHQHYFTMRLDMCVEGNNNSIFEVNSEPDPVDTRNPFGNAWTAQTTPLITEQQAQRQADPTHGRYWLLTNPSVHNKLGQPVGYKLILGSTATPVAAPDSAAAKRAAFVSKNLWATRYHPDELFAAGRFPNQRNGGHGLPEYSADNRNIQDSDLVVWLNFGDHHIVRPEDWPVMPVTTAGFALKPFGFFDGNPALDLPASMGRATPKSVYSSRSSVKGRAVAVLSLCRHYLATLGESPTLP